MTALAAASPSYWAFVAIFACGRPLLSATNGLAQVTAAEQTASADRAKAVALIAAGYGTGAGVIAVVHSLAASTLGFRGVFALALVPRPCCPCSGAGSRSLTGSPSPQPGPGIRSRCSMPWPGRSGAGLAIIVVLAFTMSVITPPANSFVFLFAQNVLRLPGIVTAGMVVGKARRAHRAPSLTVAGGTKSPQRLTGALAIVTWPCSPPGTYTGSAQGCW